MALIVETFVGPLDLEIATLALGDPDPLKALYAHGAHQALLWVRKGGIKPTAALAQLDVVIQQAAAGCDKFADSDDLPTFPAPSSVQ